MKQSNKKIGWQKYESVIEEQMNSPILLSLMSNLQKLQAQQLDDQSVEDDEDESEDLGFESGTMMYPISNQLIQDISLLSNFDCWIGHTNFDITKDVKNILDAANGVEALKIYSRYRFFIGVGKMFDFKNVRKEIETKLIMEE